MKQRLVLLLLGLTTALSAAPGPKNVIVMISDGGGFNHYAAGALYRRGQLGQGLLDRFPVKLAMSTYSSQGHGYDPPKTWADYEHAKLRPTDSAAAATTLSSGVKTYNAAIGVDPDKKPVKHLLERAEELGKKTGVVSSVPISHATPAGFVAHNASRSAYA
ncbi:MAG: alkaline phosphatase, partial [Armatimonadetes bacterium]|nr:alkaline phosphatase [Armatimonadota bacterium]